ncbi:hypothetical protein ABTK05_19665, partial [Acinetobacter baumannii]
DFMKANAAGVAARETGTWPRPVALPDVALDCRRAGITHARQWQGQRIRLVVAGASAPAEDPRLQSVLLGSDGRAPRSAVGSIDCASHDASALRAIAILT